MRRKSSPRGCPSGASAAQGVSRVRVRDAPSPVSFGTTDVQLEADRGNLRSHGSDGESAELLPVPASGGFTSMKLEGLAVGRRPVAGARGVATEGW